MAKLKDLVVAIGANTTDFDKKLGKSMHKIKAFGKNTKRLGKDLSMSLTAPIAALGFTAVKAFQQQAKAIAQVEAGLKSTGASVGFTSQQLQQMASDLQSKTLFGDEQILQDATAQLLTFTNITGEQFARTQQAALDLATRLDGDLKGASIQLGKALNDPVANLSALSRSGIQFSDEQKEVIKSMAETGRLAEAQTLILDELNKQYGGSAEAAAKADGGFTQLANSFGDLQEEFGKILVDVLQPVVEFLKETIKSLQQASPRFKKMAVTISLVAAAIGPLLMILPMLVQGFMMLGSIISGAVTAAMTGLSAAFTFLLTPVGAVIGVIALLLTGILIFSEEASKPLAAVANYFISLYNEITFVRAIIGALKGVVQTVFDFFGFAVDSVIGAFKDLGAIIKALFEGDFSAIPGLVATAFDNAANRAIEFGKKAGENIMEGITNELERDPVEFVTDEQVLDGINKVKGLATQAKELLTGLFSFEGGGGGGVTAAPTGPANMQGMTARTGADAMAGMSGNEAMGGLIGIEVYAQRVKDATKIHNAAIDESEKRDASYISSVQQLANSLTSSFSNLFRGLIEGTQSFGDFMKQIIMDLLVKLASMVAAFLVISALTGGIATAGGGTMNLGGFLKQGFGLTGFADGGIVSGPTAALVGEYSGARTNPEVIAPLDKLQSMIQGSGGGNVTVTGRISGKDIVLSNERAGRDRSRIK
jgi:hypothetical protein